MKELEDKIRTALLEAVDFDLYRGFTILDGACESITKEVKDIAIEFAKYTFITCLKNMDASKDWEELFDQFIKERYGKL